MTTPVWPDVWLFLKILGQLQQWTFAQWHKTFAKVSLKYANYYTNCQRLEMFCQSGEISSNLVTLMTVQNDFPMSHLVGC